MTEYEPSPEDDELEATIRQLCYRWTTSARAAPSTG